MPKGSFFGRYSIRYHVFDALFLLGIGRIRASVLPDFERHIQKSQKDKPKWAETHKKLQPKTSKP